MSNATIRWCMSLLVKVGIWHITKFCCIAEIDRNRGIADMARPAVGSTQWRLTRT
jgi:hypothetical protein